jgi:hypothetical protein
MRRDAAVGFALPVVVVEQDDRTTLAQEGLQGAVNTLRWPPASCRMGSIRVD